MKKPFSPKPSWELDPSHLCPCGSGLKFRQCCRGNEGLIDQYKGFMQAHRYADAERASRAELSRYIGWIFKHTVSLLKSGAPIAKKIVTIDLNAVSELSDRLAWLLEKQGKRESILPMFAHLGALVPLPCARQRMVYHRCLWLIFDGQQNMAEAAVADWSNHSEIEDFRLLQVYFEIKADSLSLLKQIETLEHILLATDGPDEKLHYSIAKAFCLLLLNDTAEAKKVITSAFDGYFVAAAAEAESGDYYACWSCSQSLEIRGTVFQDKAAYERALHFLDKVELSGLLPKGIADIEYHKGLMHFRRDANLDAVRHFGAAFDANPSALPLIYRAEAFVRLDRLSDAKNDIDQIRKMGMPQHWKLEFLRTVSSYVVRAKDTAGARSTLGELKSLDLEILHFQTQRDDLCITLLEFINEAQDTSNKDPSWPLALWRKIQAISEYLELKPNFCGLGLNLNKALEPRKDEKGVALE
jgi:hypothetical protein